MIVFRFETTDGFVTAAEVTIPSRKMGRSTETTVLSMTPWPIERVVAADLRRRIPGEVEIGLMLRAWSTESLPPTDEGQPRSIHRIAFE